MGLSPFNVALIIPTGIGASIGGFGGDGMVLLPLLSSLCDTVITHPNVANAACFQRLSDNTLYVEGYGLDRFFQGTWRLSPVRQNRIGILWDSGIPEDMEILHRNTLAAVETVYGVNILGLERTQTPVRLTLREEASGRSAGVIGNPDVLLEAGQQLIDQGATALAVCCLMPEPEDSHYQKGTGVDPIAGLEAMISHFLVSAFQLAVAHAPVFPYDKALPVTDTLVDPRAASEYIVSTFLPCVLTGLAKAPQFITQSTAPSGLGVSDISALVVPADALGSLPVLSAIKHQIPVLAVQNNETVMQCSPESLGIHDKVTLCNTYMEALGYLVALKQGITLPQHFMRVPLTTESKEPVYTNA
jgi:hypothetical protein